MSVPADVDCAQVRDRLLVPGGSEPAAGPADVNTAQKPASPTPAPDSTSAAASRARPQGIVDRAARLPGQPARQGPAGGAPRRRARALQHSRSGRVTLSVMQGHRARGRIVFSGAPGVNSVRFTASS
jgi:hypothetical protein